MKPCDAKRCLRHWKDRASESCPDACSQRRRAGQQDANSLSARTRRGLELVPLNEIRFFQTDLKYITVRHENGEVLIDDTLRDLENEFGDKVVRIHRNALVMMDHLGVLERDARGHYQVKMRGVDEKLAVSRRHVSGLRKLVQVLQSRSDSGTPTIEGSQGCLFCGW